MASRLLHSMADDSPDLQKEIGCVTGMFQLFDRRYLVGGSCISHDAIPSGYNPHFRPKNIDTDFLQRKKAVSQEMHRKSSVKHENDRISTESSTSSSSSLGSSKTIQREAKASPNNMQFEDSLKSLQQEKIKKTRPSDLRESLRALAKLREGPSLFNESIQFPGSSFEANPHKDDPRVSFESRVSVDNKEFAEDSGSFRERGKNKPLSVVARLMGLEAFPSSCKNSDSSPSRLNLDTQVRSSNCSKGAVRDEESPKPTCEIERRLKDLQSKQSGTDLRAIKEILKAMQSSFTVEESSIVIMKPTKIVEKCEVHRNLQPKKPSRQSKQQANESISRGGKPGHASVNSELRVDAMGSVQKTQWFYEDRLCLDEVASVTTEHSSPMSVLDISAYTDGLSSPVKPIQKSPRYDDRDCEGKYEDKGLVLMNQRKFQNIDNLVQKLKKLNSRHDDEKTDYIALLCETSNEDHKYISEILLRSGILLQDLSTFQLHDPYPINPELFSVLEHKKAGQLPREKLVKQEKIHRKLIFDLVNEILAVKLVKADNLNAQKLLKELCFEIEGLQATRNAERDTEDEDDGSLRRILSEEVMKEGGKWKEGGDVVSEIENLVLKELVDEIVNGEVCGSRSTRQSRARRLRF